MTYLRQAPGLFSPTPKGAKHRIGEMAIQSAGNPVGIAKDLI
jgi:hypothetical protein